MRPDNMPRPFAPEHSEKLTNLERLKVMRDYYALPPAKLPKVAALTAAIELFEAVENGHRVQAGSDGWIECSVDQKCVDYIIIPADAVKP